jgi:preprotein translocase subunit Sec63
MNTIITFYSILGVGESAGDIEIKTAFHKKAQMLHPDKGGSKEIFQLINEAYHTLSDPARRAEYDRTLNSLSFQQPNQSDCEDSEIPETSPNIVIVIFRFLLYLGLYVLLYWGLMSIGKWLHLETLSYFVYFFIVYYLYFKSSK